MIKKLNSDNQGQILLLVVVSLAVLLGVGLSVSSQTISSIVRTSRSDSLQKVTAAAEGGLESYLIKTDNALEILGTSTATVEYPASNTKAVISISPLKTSDDLVFDTLDPGEVATFYFTGSPATSYSPGSTCLQISFSAPSDGVVPDFMMNVVYKNTGTVSTFKSFNATDPATGLTKFYDATTSNQHLMAKYLYSGSSSSFTGSFYDALGNPINAAPTSCGTDGNSYSFSNAVVLRIHPLNGSLNNLTIHLVSSSDANLKNVLQGYKIKSVGQFANTADTTTRTIESVKYLDAPSNVFDYAAFMDN